MTDILNSNSTGSDSKDLGSKEIEVTQKKGSEVGTGSALGHHAFNPKRKKLFVRSALKLWPNVTKICEVVNISCPTYYAHLKSDPDFAQAMRDVDQAVTDEIEGVLRKEASKPKRFLDRISYLRAHRPELYDRAKVIKVEGYRVTDAEAGKMRNELAGAVDAEIVQSFKQKTERKSALKALGEGSGGGTGGAVGGQQ